MPLLEDLPFLLRLVDDPSPTVRSKVATRLRLLGNQIWREIEAQELPLSRSQRDALEEIFEGLCDDTLLDIWCSLDDEPDEHVYLERALLALADWQCGSDTGERGRHLLDQLAEEFLVRERPRDSIALANFLFDFCALKGAAPDDYYNPLNSNIVYALEERRGLPITLTAVFILVGSRVGLEIEGCNFPGHFLARDGRRHTVFDPFNGGRVLSAREVATLRKAAPLEMTVATPAREIVGRVLRNLSVSYHQDGQIQKSELMIALIREMDGA